MQRIHFVGTTVAFILRVKLFFSLGWNQYLGVDSRTVQKAQSRLTARKSDFLHKLKGHITIKDTNTGHAMELCRAVCNLLRHDI